MSVETIGLLALVLAAGGAIGYYVNHILAKGKVDSAEARAAKIMEEAKVRERNFLIQAKEKGIKIIEDAKRDEVARRSDLSEVQKRLDKREAMFDAKLLDLQTSQEKLVAKQKEADDKLAEIKKVRDQEIQKLETVAGMTRDQAKDEIIRLVQDFARDEVTSRLRKVQDESSEEVLREARKVLSTAVMRIASSHSVETTTTTVQLPSDDMKGRIIGKEGRNIKAIEMATGTEIIVDETPNVITISGFSPIRRQIAKRALDKLLSDGRIHPGRIEETVEEAKKELALDIKKAGEDALFEMGITGVDPKLVSILGRLKYRTSYGQNVLVHAMEVGNIGALIAGEIGANVMVCKKGGLFHDIGKAVDHDIQGTHPELGLALMRKFGFPEEVAYMSIAHHEDKPKTIEGCIVRAADAISGARPGARRDSLEQYVKRLEELEGIATSFPGVEKSYAISAGRELRVFVTPKEVDDFTAYRMARDIANRIENELHYPGEVRVTLIRETRVIEYAR